MFQNYKKYIFLVPAVLLLLYTSVRACRLSFTIDEASSFMYYCQGTYADILHPHMVEANNHILNSILMKFFSAWLPLSELTLRLQSLLAHAIFLVFTWLLLKDFKNTWLKLAVYLILNLNPYMLDFFSLARGYALSWAMMTGSLYFLKSLAEHKTGQLKYIYLSFLFAALAVLANFTQLDYYIALLLFYVLFLFYHILVKGKKILKKRWFWGSLTMVCLISIPLFNFSLPRLYSLKDAHRFTWGGPSGFWTDTVGSLIDYTKYDINYPIGINGIIKFLIVLVLFFCIFFLVRGIVLKIKTRTGFTSFEISIPAKQKKLVFLAAFTFIFCTVVFFILAQFYLQHVPFIRQRAAIFIMILFSFLFACLVHVIPGKLAPGAVAGTVLVFCLIHFAGAFNFSYVTEWKMNADSRQVMADIDAAKAKEIYKDKKEILVQVPAIYVSTTLFYKYLYHDDRLQFIERDKGLNQAADFYYLYDTTGAISKNPGIETIKTYPLSHSILLKNLDSRVQKLLYHNLVNMQDTVKKDASLLKDNKPATIENVNCISVKKGAFAPTTIFDLKNSNKARSLNVKAVAKVYFPSGHKSGDLSIALFGKDGKVLEWHSLKFENFYAKNTGWMNIPYEVDFTNIPFNAGVIKAFVWNTGDDTINIAEMEVDVKGM